MKAVVIWNCGLIIANYFLLVFIKSYICDIKLSNG